MKNYNLSVTEVLDPTLKKVFPEFLISPSGSYRVSSYYTNIKALQNSHRGAYGQAAVRHAVMARRQEAETVIIIAKMSTQTINRTL